MGVAIVAEDWDGARWYYDPAQSDTDGGPLWHTCVSAPLDPPVAIVAGEDDDEPIVRWRGWAGDTAHCEDVSWSTGIGEYRDPVTAVLYTEGAWDLCAFDPWMEHVSGERSRQDMGWRAPRAAGFMDPDDARVTYLQFPDGAEYSLICTTPRDPDQAEPWAAYLVPGLAGGTPPMPNTGGAVD